MKRPLAPPELDRVLAGLRRAGRDRRRLFLALAGLGLVLYLAWEALSGARPAPGVAAAPDPLASGGLLVDVILKLGLVIALVYGSLYALRRWPGGALGARPARRLAVLETSRLSPRQAVHLLRVGERTLLVGATDQAVTLLAEIEPEPLPAIEPQPASAPFVDVLRAVAQPNGRAHAAN